MCEFVGFKYGKYTCTPYPTCSKYPMSYSPGQILEKWLRTWKGCREQEHHGSQPLLSRSFENYNQKPECHKNDGSPEPQFTEHE